MFDFLKSKNIYTTGNTKIARSRELVEQFLQTELDSLHIAGYYDEPMCFSCTMALKIKKGNFVFVLDSVGAGWSSKSRFVSFVPAARPSWLSTHMYIDSDLREAVEKKFLEYKEYIEKTVALQISEAVDADINYTKETK